ncbi:MAG: hypothetical protein WCG92_16700 [Hyphomicrobiales bacterium]
MVALLAAVSIEMLTAAIDSSPRKRAPNINDSPCAFCFERRLMVVMFAERT